MLVLKYSYLNKTKHLVKVLSNSSYGIFDLTLNKIIGEPLFDYLHYDFFEDIIWAKQGNYYFAIDIYGNRLSETTIPEKHWTCVDKNDRCPSCAGDGCSSCHGFGIIPIGGNFALYFLID